MQIHKMTLMPPAEPKNGTKAVAINYWDSNLQTAITRVVFVPEDTDRPAIFAHLGTPVGVNPEKAIRAFLDAGHKELTLITG